MEGGGGGGGKSYGREHDHAIVERTRHEHVPGDRMNTNTPQAVEMIRSAALAAKRTQMRALPIEDLQTMIVAVSHNDVAAAERMQSEAAGCAELMSTRALRAEATTKLAFRGETETR